MTPLATAAIGFLGTEIGGDRLAAVGHRVVHGGLDFAQPVVVDATVAAPSCVRACS